MNTQVCKKCEEEKPLEEFYKHYKAKSGYRQPCKDCAKVYENERYAKLKSSGATYIKNKKESARERGLRQKYGITTEIYSDLLDKQNGCCAICQRHESEFNRKLAVDHAHSGSEYIPEGMIRGLLCWSCNRLVIGKHTDPDIFERASHYLRSHSGFKVPDNYIRPKKKRKKRKVKAA